MEKQLTRKEWARQELERVARLIANQDEAMTGGRWITRKQTSWIVSCLVRAGYIGERPWGSDGFRKTVCYDSPCCRISVSPLNGCGCFWYAGTPEWRKADLERRAEERRGREEALEKAVSKDIADLEEAARWMEDAISKDPDDHAMISFLDLTKRNIEAKRKALNHV